MLKIPEWFIHKIIDIKKLSCEKLCQIVSKFAHVVYHNDSSFRAYLDNNLILFDIDGSECKIMISDSDIEGSMQSSNKILEDIDLFF